MMKKFVKKFYKDLFDQKDKTTESAFVSDVMDGLYVWANTWAANEFERRLEQYKLGLEVCIHNTSVMENEKLADLKVVCGQKFQELLVKCNS